MDAHCVADGASSVLPRSDSISVQVTQGFALAVRCGATKEQFDATVGIHPTNAEVFTTMDITRASGEDWVISGGCGGGKCG